MEVIGTKGRIALGAFPLAGVIARLDTFKAEDVKTFSEDSILLAHVATRAGQLGLEGRTDRQTDKGEAGSEAAFAFSAVPQPPPHLVLFDLLLQDLVGVSVHLHFALFLQLAPQTGNVLLGERQTKINGTKKGKKHAEVPQHDRS